MMEVDENKAVRIKKLDALKAKGIDAYAQRSSVRIRLRIF